MRNAVIRKKKLREQALIRQYLLAPQRFIMGSQAVDVDWRKYGTPALWTGWGL